MSSPASGAVEAFVNPWLWIWFRPRVTIRQVAANFPTRHVLLLGAAAGAAGAVSHLAGVMRPGPWSMGYTIDLTSLGARLLLGAFVGIVALYANAALGLLIGRMLRGEASMRDLRAALAWAQVPLFLALVLTLGFLGLLTVPQLQGSAADRPTVDNIVMYVSWAVGGLELWSFVLTLGTVSAVQRFGIVRAAFTVLIASILVFLILSLRYATFQTFATSTPGMTPTLLAGDSFFVNKLAYGYGRYSFWVVDLRFSGRLWGAEPVRGDLVLVRGPFGHGFVKRVIGLPGEEIILSGDTLTINGQPVPQEKVERLGADGRPIDLGFFVYRETLPNGRSHQVYAAGTGASAEAPRSYTVPQGQYFVLDDNRDNEAGTRFPDTLFAPYENLLGRVSMIFYSKDGGGDVRWERLGRIPQ